MTEKGLFEAGLEAQNWPRPPRAFRRRFLSEGETWAELRWVEERGLLTKAETLERKQLLVFYGRVDIKRGIEVP